MTIVRHPTLDVSYDVPESAVSQWAGAGWHAEQPAGLDTAAVSTDVDPPTPTGGRRRNRQQ